MALSMSTGTVIVKLPRHFANFRFYKAKQAHSRALGVIVGRNSNGSAIQDHSARTFSVCSVAKIKAHHYVGYPSGNNPSIRKSHSAAQFHYLTPGFNISKSKNQVWQNLKIQIPNLQLQNLQYSGLPKGNILMDSSSQVLFRQLFEHKSCTYTYLLACNRTKEAALIDPVIEMVPRDVKLLHQLGYSLKYALNTHVHADHITGSGKLKEHFSGAKSVLGIDSGAKADIHVDHLQTLQIGDITLEARKTPGHTNGCMTYVWHSQKKVFCGDAILIRGCGRTDFQQGDADKLYSSVHTQIFTLPDKYSIFPAHDYTGQPWTTVGEEKMHNPRLTKERAVFIDLMNNLNLPYPKQIDRALPANLMCGIVDEPAKD